MRSTSASISTRRSATGAFCCSGIARTSCTRATQAVSPTQVDGGPRTAHHAALPARIIIDTFSPFVSGSAPVAPVVVALAAFLEQSGSTSLLTFPEDLSDGYDRSLEPIVQASAAVIRLASEDAGVRRAELLSLRYPPPLATDDAVRRSRRRWRHWRTRRARRATDAQGPVDAVRPALRPERRLH